MERSPVRVLLIEDDQDDYLIASRLLAKSNEPVFQLSWGNTLAKGLEHLTPDIEAILLDLTLPDAQGWETFVAVRDRAGDVPIIVLTGLMDEALALRAVHEGAQDYLMKGQLSGHFLRRAVLYAIERRKTKAQLERLVEELRIHNEQMDADVQLAREVQLALLPGQFPAFPPDAPPERGALRFAHLYRPCRTVGGDFFAAFAVSETVAGVFVCDVMGHGMRSALVTAILRGLLEELRPKAHDPGRLLTELNRALVAVLRLPNHLIFASALYLTVDTRAARVTVSNAGHPSPLLVHAGDRQVVPLRATGPGFGPALGIGAEQTYGTHSWPLSCGDRLLLITDGLSEAANSTGVEFGDRRLVESVSRGASLPLPEWPPAIVADAELHAGTTEFEDDVCIVAVEYGGNGNTD
jgi:sigma-B regulation protein RsbU (phosphoserine phosphatase)